MQFPFSFWKQSSGASIISTNGLVHYYRLDEGSGPVFHDIIGGANLLPRCQPEFWPGNLLINNPNNASVYRPLSFHCTGNNCLTGLYTGNLQVKTNKTIAFWAVSLSGIPSNPNGGNSSYVPTVLGSSSFGYGFWYGTITGNQISTFSSKTGIGTFCVSPTGAFAVINNSGFSHGDWHFVVCSIDLANNIEYLQINNQGTGFSISNSFSNVNNNPNPGQVFSIGSFPFTSAFSGNFAVQEVSIWNRILNANEKTLLYNNGKGRTYPFAF